VIGWPAVSDVWFPAHCTRQAITIIHRGINELKAKRGSSVRSIYDYNRYYTSRTYNVYIRIVYAKVGVWKVLEREREKEKDHRNRTTIFLNHSHLRIVWRELLPAPFYSRYSSGLGPFAEHHVRNIIQPYQTEKKLTTRGCSIRLLAVTSI